MKKSKNEPDRGKMGVFSRVSQEGSEAAIAIGLALLESRLERANRKIAKYHEGLRLHYPEGKPPSELVPIEPVFRISPHVT